jgi:hypothetical protein
MVRFHVAAALIRRGIAVAALMFASAAQAQDVTVASVQDAATIAREDPEAIARQDAVRRNVAPDADVRTGLAGSGVQLLAGGDTTAVTLSASRTWDTVGPNRLGYNQASVVVTAPVTDKKKGEGAFVTEGGLARSLSVQASFTIAFSGNPPDFATPEQRRILFQRQVEQCQREAASAAAKSACATMNFRDGGGAGEDVWTESPLFFLGVAGGVGRKPFEYRRLSDFAEQEVSRTEYSVSGFVGVNPNSRPLYLGAGYEYRRQYVAATSRTLCQPSVAGAPQECFSSAFAEPERDIDSLAFAVARWRGKLPLGTGLPLGISAKVAYDTRDRVFGVGVPVYFIPDGTGGLRGGVRVDWQDVRGEDNDLALRIFVGVPFTLFGN